MSSSVEAVLSPRQPAFWHRRCDISGADVTKGARLSRSAGNRRASATDAGGARPLGGLVHQAGAAPGQPGPKRSGARNGAGRPTGSYLFAAIQSIRSQQVEPSDHDTIRHAGASQPTHVRPARDARYTGSTATPASVRHERPRPKTCRFAGGRFARGCWWRCRSEHGRADVPCH
jgi:hypothetical protein